MSNSFKMLSLVTDAWGGRGGIAQYNRDFLGAAAENGSVSSITVLPRLAPDPSAPPKSIEQLPARSGRTAYSVAAFRIALSRPFDVVFCGHLYMAPLAAAIAKMKGAKLIMQTHGIEAWPRPTKLQRAATESADLVLCVSRYTRGAVLSWAALEPERVLVVPNTVREVFTPGDGSAMRTALGLDGKKVLVTVSRLDAGQQYKGQDRVIKAIPYLVAQGHDICYLVIGEGDDTPRLQGLACQTGVAERVRFLGPVKLEKLIDIYRMVDLFVMPSVGEGFGIVFLEAMAAGAPALGLGMAGARDALADGQLGTITSERELASTIERLLEAPKPDPVKLASMTRALFGRKQFLSSTSTALHRLLRA